MELSVIDGMRHPMHYRTPFWKLALGGIIAGSALYFFPFFLPALAFVFLMGLMFRLFAGGHRGHRGMHPAFAYWRQASAEDRQAFMAKHADEFAHCGRGGLRPEPATETSDNK